MKLRNGFVSNSSSSSFIIAIAIINDEDKFIKWAKSLGDIRNRLHIITDEDLTKFLKDYNLNYHILDIAYDVNKNAISISASNDLYSIELDLKDLANHGKHLPVNEYAKKLLLDKFPSIVYVCISNNEGDHAFYDNFNQELDYDITLDYFSQEQQDLYNGFCEENGLISIDKLFGAGRDG